MNTQDRLLWLSRVCLVLLFGWCSPLQAQLIDFHWGSATQTGPAALGSTTSDIWQSTTLANNSTPLTLNDVTGAATTVTLTWVTGTDGYPGTLDDLQSSEYWSPYDAATKALMESYLQAYEYSGNRGAVTMNLAGLTPSAPYTLVIYGAPLYAWGTSYSVTGTGTFTGATTGANRKISSGPGVAYIVLNVVSSSSGSLALTTTVSGGYATLNGFQLMAQTPAVPLNEFLNSLGINTHIDLQHKGQGSLESVYEPLFEYTGIRNDRDDADYSTTASALVTMHNNTGVNICLGGYNFTSQQTAANTLATAGALLALEGPNEPGNFGQSYPANGGPKGGGTALQSGLKLSGAVISGTLTTAGNYSIALSASNSSGAGLGTLTVIVNSTSNTIPVINSAAAASAANSPFIYNITATNSPTSFTAIGLPPGLSVNPSTGAITGTPTPTSGTYPIGLSASNSSGTGYANMTLVINPSASTPVISSVGAISVLTNTAISYTITASNSPTTYAATSGWLPIAEYQRDLFAYASTSPTLSAYPVFSVSMPGAETSNLGLQFLTIPTGTGCEMPDGTVYADYANAHNYVCGNVAYPIGDNWPWQAADPTLSTGSHWDGLHGEFGHTWLKGYTGYSNTQLLTLPRVTTETGWQTSGTDSVSQDQQGRTLMNVYLAQYKRGYAYTFIYQMIDKEGGDTDTFGIYSSASSPKTAAVDIHNFTTTLADTTTATVGSLAYWIPGEPSTVHDLLMQRSDGTYFLVVWDERVEGTGTDNITVTLGGTATTVNEYDPTLGTMVTSSLSNVSSISLSMTDHPIIVAISGLH